MPPPLEALVALNAAVFLAWLLLPRRWMARHFELAAGALRRRPWTAVTATVSHASLFDLTGNMPRRAAGSRLSRCATPLKGVGGPQEVQGVKLQAGWRDPPLVAWTAGSCETGSLAGGPIIGWYRLGHAHLRSVVPDRGFVKETAGSSQVVCCGAACLRKFVKGSMPARADAAAGGARRCRRSWAGRASWRSTWRAACSPIWPPTPGTSRCAGAAAGPSRHGALPSQH